MSCTALTNSKTISFLAYTNNAEELAADPDLFYPRGRNMWLGFYSSTNSQMNSLKARGFKYTGPHYNYNNSIKYAAKIGMRSLARLYGITYGLNTLPGYGLNDGDTDWGSSACKSTHAAELVKTEAGRQLVRDNVASRVNLILNQTPLDNSILTMDEAIVGWYMCPEELKYPPNNDFSYTVTYLRIVQEQINISDPKKRPIIYSDAGNMTEEWAKRSSSYVSSVSYQIYQIVDVKSAYFYGSGYPTQTNIEDKLQYRTHVLEDFTKSKNVADDGLDQNGEKRIMCPALSCYLDPGSSEPHNCDWTTEDPPRPIPKYIFDAKDRLSEAWLSKCIRHDTWAALVWGAHGLSPWSHAYLSTKSPGGFYMSETVAHQAEQYISNMELIIKSEAEYAFLWGRNKKGTSQGISLSKSGPYLTYKYPRFSSTFTADSIHYSDIQHNKKRFICIINSHPQNDHNSAVGKIPIVIGNLPTTQVKAIDLFTGNTINISSGSYSKTLEPLEVFIIVIQPADGYCGGDTVSVPTVGRATADKSVYELGDSAAITATATGDTSRNWQYRNEGETLESDWKNI